MRRKPSDKGTLTARMIDRPIRPGFADGFKQEVHIVATTLACDGQNPPDCICVGGASAALLCGGTPFDGPAACVRIARNVETGEFIVNPTYAEQETSPTSSSPSLAPKTTSLWSKPALRRVSEEDMLAAMDVRPAGHRRLLREAGGILGQGRSRAQGISRACADASIAERVDAHL